MMEDVIAMKVEARAAASGTATRMRIGIAAMRARRGGAIAATLGVTGQIARMRATRLACGIATGSFVDRIVRAAVDVDVVNRLAANDDDRVGR